MAEPVAATLGPHPEPAHRAPVTGRDHALETDRPEAAPLAPPALHHRSRRRRSVSLSLRFLVPAVLVVLWWVLTGTGAVGPDLLSSPAATWDAARALYDHQDLVADVGISLARAGTGLALGGLVGLLLGCLTGLFDLGEELLDATLQMARVVPFPALIFLFIVWFGIGEQAKVALIALAATFPLYLSTANGVRNVDRKVVEAARTFGLRGRRLVGRVVLPLALPSILTGLRFSAGVSVIALVFAETINASQGIGYLASQAAALQQTAVLVVCILLYALLGIGVDLAVRGLERLLMPWRAHLAVR
jgi:sulfonate transport system permease protein